jgi:hypothetical protein
MGGEAGAPMLCRLCVGQHRQANTPNTPLWRRSDTTFPIATMTYLVTTRVIASIQTAIDSPFACYAR